MPKLLYRLTGMPVMGKKQLNRLLRETSGSTAATSPKLEKDVTATFRNLTQSRGDFTTLASLKRCTLTARKSTTFAR
jgi:hypothetical protein